MHGSPTEEVLRRFEAEGIVEQLIFTASTAALGTAQSTIDDYLEHAEATLRERGVEEGGMKESTVRRWMRRVDPLQTAWNLEVTAFEAGNIDLPEMQRIMLELRKLLIDASPSFKTYDGFDPALKACDRANRVNLNVKVGGTNVSEFVELGKTAFEKLAENLLPALREALERQESQTQAQSTAVVPEPGERAIPRAFVGSSVEGLGVADAINVKSGL
ncbi:MAG: hypothetical protein HY319_25315 [Armatimonadetes bacterium]|nr:hypothetical protein [Armatimonadota bacterium]